MRAIFALLLFLWAMASVSEGRADTFAYLPKTDGTIARFRMDARTGALIPQGTTDTGFHRLPTFTVSADKRFLYVSRAFDADKDGYTFESSSPENVKAVRTRPTPFTVFAIETGGGLRRVQAIPLPGPIGSVIAHPNGRFVYALTADGAFCLHTTGERGTLRYIKRLSIDSGLGLENTPGVVAGWWLTFSPSGKYLYDHSYGGFEIEIGSSLQRYRVNTATGGLRPDGVPGSTHATLHPTNDLTGGIWCWINQTAFLASGDTFTICRSKNERLVGRGVRNALKPMKESSYGSDPVLIRHPKLPIAVYRGSLADPYTLWRVVGPEKIKKAGAFASAFPSVWSESGGAPNPGKSIVFAPNGRFLYELAAVRKDGDARQAAVFAVTPNGTSITPCLPPFSLPAGSGDTLTFVTANPKRK